MPRTMSTAMLSAIAAGELFPAFFVLATFRTGPIYVWSGIGNIVWNTQTWVGLGALAGISAIDEGATVEAKGITLTLSGIDSTLLPDVMTEFQLGQPVTVYLGLFNSNVLIADPVTTFAGRMDLPQIDVDGKTAMISINCESRLIDMDYASNFRLTQEDNQLHYPGDLGLQFVTSIQEMSWYWGTSPASSTTV